MFAREVMPHLQKKNGQPANGAGTPALAAHG
jgi:hypothetical protein